MALTRESFCRYASSTCQRTSSDREPTLRSSKFWGGRLLASRLCKASYKFVCCGLLRAWCSRGLPILVSRAARLLALHRGVAGSVTMCQGERWRLPTGPWLPLPRQALPAGCALPWESSGFWCGLRASTPCADASSHYYRGYSDASWGRLPCGSGSGCLKFTSNRCSRDGCVGAAQLKTHAAVVPRRQHLPHSKCTRIG